jgi:hypothetical protein
MPKYLGDVRCWVNCGKHVLAMSFSEFDPKPTKPIFVERSACISEADQMKLQLNAAFDPEETLS